MTAERRGIREEWLPYLLLYNSIKNNLTLIYQAKTNKKEKKKVILAFVVCIN